MSIASTLTLQDFKTTVKYDDGNPLMFKLAADDNVEAIQALAVLPYFKELINEENEEGWTPILIAAT